MLTSASKYWCLSSTNMSRCIRIGIGMDASITPLRHSGLSLVQTTDFFYPLVEDPYMQVLLYFLDSG